MALTSAFIEAHVLKWERNLATPFHSYREKWPSRLFHHAPLENAVDILKDGHLRSRNDVRSTLKRDVAAEGVIDNRTHAHQFARLYFRPKTPTQYYIEGIRKPGECYASTSQAPILIMLLFDARRVLGSGDIQFCDRNMQLGNSVIGSDSEYFEQIPFDKVFHEGGINGDRSIIDHRCAEVLAQSPLPLKNTLQWIYCRSEAEKSTLMYFLGTASITWRHKILISDDYLVFKREHTFVDTISIDPSGIVLKLNPRKDRQKIDVSVTVLSSEGEVVINFRNRSMDAVPVLPATSDRWRIKGALANGVYLVEVRLEGELGFKAKLSVGNNLIF